MEIRWGATNIATSSIHFMFTVNRGHLDEGRAALKQTSSKFIKVLQKQRFQKLMNAGRFWHCFRKQTTKKNRETNGIETHVFFGFVFWSVSWNFYDFGSILRSPGLSKNCQNRKKSRSGHVWNAFWIPERFWSRFWNDFSRFWMDCAVFWEDLGG